MINDAANGFRAGYAFDHWGRPRSTLGFSPNWLEARVAPVGTTASYQFGCCHRPGRDESEIKTNTTEHVLVNIILDSKSSKEPSRLMFLGRACCGQVAHMIARPGMADLVKGVP